MPHNARKPGQGACHTKHASRGACHAKHMSARHCTSKSGGPSVRPRKGNGIFFFTFCKVGYSTFLPIIQSMHPPCQWSPRDVNGFFLDSDVCLVTAVCKKVDSNVSCGKEKKK